MKNIKNLIFLILIFLLFSKCGAFNEKNRQNKSEEFLVEKKSPLVLPPEFEKLPVPNSQIEEQNENIKDLIISKDVENIEINEDLNTSGSLQESVIKKIQKD